MKKRSQADILKLLPLLDAQVGASELKFRAILSRLKELGEILESLNPDAVKIGASSRSIQEHHNDIDHLRWIDGRRAAINIELAKNRTLAEMAKADLRRQWTRRDSLKRLIKGLPSDRGSGDDYGS